MFSPAYSIALLILMNLVWAGSYAVIKYGLGSMDPLALVFWRLLAGFLLLSAWIRLRRTPVRIDRRDAVRIALAGLCLAASSSLVVIGIELSRATEASLLYAFEPVWGIILASIMLRERLLPSTAAGLVFVLAGVAALSGFDPHALLGISEAGAGLGNVLLVLGLLGESLFTIILKPVAERLDAAAVFAGVLLVAISALALPVMRWADLTFVVSGQSIFAIAYLSILCTALGYTLWVAVMKSVPVNIMLFTIFIQPVSGMLIASWTLGEPIDTRLAVGGAMLVAGMGVAVLGHVRVNKTRQSGIKNAAAATAA